MPPFGKSRKIEQNAAQAVREIESLSQQVAALQENLAHTKNVLEGLWSIFKQETGKTDQELAAVVKQIEEAKAAAPHEAEKCPSCGRALQERSKACIYCGTLVTNRRLF